MRRVSFRSGRLDWPLVAILVGALVVRLWGIAFGLPSVDARPDETTVTNVAITFFTGDLNPHFFNYPTAYMYLLSLIYLCYFLLGTLIGRYRSIADFVAEYAADPTNFVLLDRLLSALLGTATILVIYKLGNRIAGRRVALISSFLLAVAHLHVRDSHFGVTDVAATFLVMCSVLFIVRSYDNGRLRDYLVAGLFAGLAASTKYAGILLVVPMWLSSFLSWRQGKQNSIWRLLDRRVAVFVIALAAAFLLGTPFILLDFPTFAADFRAELVHLARGHRVLLGPGWWYHLRYSLPLGVGWSVFAVALLGIAIFLRTDVRRAIIVCAFPLTYYGLVGKGQTVFLRYALPFVPFLCVTAAVCVVTVGDAVSKAFRIRAATVSAVLSILIALPSTCRVIRTDTLLAARDSRLMAAEWAARTLSPGAWVYFTGPVWRWHNPFPALDLLQRKYPPRMLGADAGKIADAAPLPLGLPQYGEWGYDQKTGLFTRGRVATRALPQYIVTRESPLLFPYETPEGVKQILRTRYRLVRSFHAFDSHDADQWFDQQDGFFLPFAGFRGVERPGPNLHVFQLEEPEGPLAHTRLPNAQSSPTARAMPPRRRPRQSAAANPASSAVSPTRSSSPRSSSPS